MAETPKAIKRSISFPPELFQVAQASADKSYAGNLSAYIQDLIRGRGVSPLEESEILLTLCKKLHPTIAGVIAQKFSTRPVNQARVMARLLDAIAKADPGLDLEAEIELADKAHLAEWRSISKERLKEVAMEMAQALRQHGAEPLLDLLAAEAPAPYEAGPKKPSDAVLAQEAVKDCKAKSSKSSSKAS